MPCYPWSPLSLRIGPGFKILGAEELTLRTASADVMVLSGTILHMPGTGNGAFG